MFTENLRDERHAYCLGCVESTYEEKEENEFGVRRDLLPCARNNGEA